MDASLHRSCSDGAICFLSAAAEHHSHRVAGGGRSGQGGVVQARQAAGTRALLCWKVQALGWDSSAPWAWATPAESVAQPFCGASRSFWWWVWLCAASVTTASPLMSEAARSPFFTNREWRLLQYIPLHQGTAAS